ncbi:MAG: hypothetical protein JO235_07945 [Chroococcidiopsidaceae cyanobacterium CP_BM_RX_35]|nr:hypothetical protein [Chroococcidiopsidaceae cyanobacterium CP_BM_RX_35]
MVIFHEVNVSKILEDNYELESAVLAGLTLTTSLSACSSSPASTEVAPSTAPSAANNSQPGNAMSGDAMTKLSILSASF